MTSPPLLRFTTVTGYFLQDDPSTDPDTFDYVRHPNIIAKNTKPASDNM
jgi:hypothetical protein